MADIEIKEGGEAEGSMTVDKALEVGQQLGEAAAKLEEQEQQTEELQGQVESLQFDREWVQLQIDGLYETIREQDKAIVGLIAYCEVLEEDIDSLMVEAASITENTEEDNTPATDKTTELETRKKDTPKKKRRSLFD